MVRSFLFIVFGFIVSILLYSFKAVDMDVVDDSSSGTNHLLANKNEIF